MDSSETKVTILEDAVARATRNRAKQLANLKPFKPGQSGNPNGRPKKAMVVSGMAEDASEKAIKALISLVGSSKEQVRLAAAQAILDRAFGKPKQSVDMTTTRKDVADFDLAELHSIAKSGGPRDTEAA